MTRNVAASIKARLLKRAKESHQELELVLVRYACERFLYRLGASELRDRYVLKGAALLTLWMDDPYRATRDLDFLARGPSDEESIRRMVATVCAVPCAEDGLLFDVESMELSPIRVEEEYQGLRVVLLAFLGAARIRVQLDLGFGDALTSPPHERTYPTLIDSLPAPTVRAYPPEATIAEKLEAMVSLGRRNSRMKDFHDLWALSSELSFEGPVFRDAVRACFERRRTPWIETLPDVLTTAFYEDPTLAKRWADYLRAAAFRTPPPASFETIGERILQIVAPVRDSLIAGDAFEMRWSAKGPWR